MCDPLDDIILYDMLYDIGLGFYDHTGDEEDCEQCGYKAEQNAYDEDEDWA